MNSILNMDTILQKQLQDMKELCEFEMIEKSIEMELKLEEAEYWKKEFESMKKENEMLKNQHQVQMLRAKVDVMEKQLKANNITKDIILHHEKEILLLKKQLHKTQNELSMKNIYSEQALKVADEQYEKREETNKENYLLKTELIEMEKQMKELKKDFQIPSKTTEKKTNTTTSKHKTTNKKPNNNKLPIGTLSYLHPILEKKAQSKQSYGLDGRRIISKDTTSKTLAKKTAAKRLYSFDGRRINRKDTKTKGTSPAKRLYDLDGRRINSKDTTSKTTSTSGIFEKKTPSKSRTIRKPKQY